MKQLIQFELNEKYFNWGYRDGISGIFDTWYLEKTSSDGTLSYTAGFNKAKEEKSKDLNICERFQFNKI